ncbi:MAG: hypothetical protein ABIQ77_09950 [Anaerolineales bacterium]
MKPLFIIILFVTISACGKQTVALPTETPIPTLVSPTPIPTSTFIPVTITPSPIPTKTIIPMITPDAIQVERWKEYEDALARTILSFLPREEVICEWEILGRSEQEVYIWALCTSIISSGTSPISGTEIFSSSSIPAVIHLREDGSVQSVEIPGAGSDYARDISRMFPPDVQEEIERYHFRGAGEIFEHIAWRRTHPEEPPLIVLIATPRP